MIWGGGWALGKGQEADLGDLVRQAWSHCEQPLWFLVLFALQKVSEKNVKLMII